MKILKTTALIILLAIMGNSAIAQTIDISPMYGWQMNGDINFYEGELSIDGSDMFGGTIDVMLGQGVGVRLMYSYQETNANFRPYGGYELTNPANNFAMLNDYYQIGSIKSISTGGKVEPYGVFTLGAARYKGTDNATITDSKWFFSITAGAGVKIFFNEKIGIKLEGAFMMPIYFQGIGMYFGTGGSGMSVNGAVPMLQGNFNGGLVFRINK